MFFQTQLLSTKPILAVVQASSGHSRYNYSAFVIALAAISLVLDVVVLLLPLPVLRNLQMPLRRKVGVAGVFSLGGFVVVASIARLVFLYRGIHPTLMSANKLDAYSKRAIRLIFN